eukprot:CAMPEP_0183727114 /NCGR_PEP_ID=MMETSP0737-20130205/24915_1 /TAXON_ID=385413 /ORGANISM="Thalassiosira miniscula, Strain CCMP1093" /LENGTH=931 /DNA_ID=CAMNT_0025958665 /DNA_START=83 /DNA_END=2875 /DNA_ORIENTATION=+
MPSSIVEKAFALISEAMKLEKEAQLAQRPWVVLNSSADKYHEAVFYMKNHIKKNCREMQPDMKRLLVEKSEHYEQHADKIRSVAKQQEREESQRSNEKNWVEPEPEPDPDQQSSQIKGGNTGQSCKVDEEVTRAARDFHELLAAAKDYDKRGKSSEAMSLYIQAAQCALPAIKLAPSSSKASGRTWTPTEKLISELSLSMKDAMDRVEQLKEKSTKHKGTKALPPAPAGQPQPSAPIRKNREQHKKPTPKLTKPTIEDYINSNISTSERLTPYEVKVLSWSSNIASGLFLPWDEAEARSYNYYPTKPWVDPEGLLKLSDKQKGKFDRWARPSEIAAMRRQSSSSCSISMIKGKVTPYTIKQYCVSDCSFIAGLCISAQYERHFQRRLVSSLIYPQKDGKPTYNPKGIYMVKLWLNGVARRVLVDDFLPVDKRGNLLCSHTKLLDSSAEKADGNNDLELWVSILEKAYMKLCGGYDFPGSNSGVDLFCLTGWIPERIFFPEDPNDVRDFETPEERAWDRLVSATSYGDCLVTVSTSKELTEEQAESVGLYTCHAYAVLKVYKTKNGTRLLQLKNPWASKGWKGRFSPEDRNSWSNPNFRDEVGYDASLASGYDDGVFFMSWDDVLLYFRNIHMSWSTDPLLFPCRTSLHGYWNREMGPNDDSYNVGDNPQYTITLSDRAIEKKAKLWLLLSRHVTKQEQEGAEVTDFLTLHIHRTKSPQRIHYNKGTSWTETGAYTNNQHVLVRYDSAGPEDKYLSIVLSQYQKSNDLGFTLSCYCTEECQLGQPERRLAICQQLVGSWKLRDGMTDKSFSLPLGSAGGPLGKGSFGSNPQWSIKVPSEGMRLQLKCMAPKELPVNVILARGTPGSPSQRGDFNDKSRRIHHLYEDPVIDTGSYRHGFAVSDVIKIPSGLYTLVASTFEVGQTGNFILHVLS